jgi:hypothetical protein
MSYTCNNPECSAPENRKGKLYPSAMECPFCEFDLVEEISFSEADTELIISLPVPSAKNQTIQDILAYS